MSRLVPTFSFQKKSKLLENFQFFFFKRQPICNNKYNIRKIQSNNYYYDLYTSIKNCKDGNCLFRLTQKTLQYQIHDLFIWRLIEEKFGELKNELNPKDLSLIINYFKQIKINNSSIYENSIDLIVSSIDKFSIHDLSLICLSYAYFKKKKISFMNIIANAIIKLYEQEKDHIQTISKKELYNTFISHVHIIGSFSKLQIKNIQIFKIASIYIYHVLHSDISIPIPPNIFLKIITSYTSLKIKHVQVFGLIVKHLPTVKISDEELKIVHENFKKVKYTDETFDKYVQYRLS